MAVVTALGGCGGDDDESSSGDGTTDVKVGVIPIVDVAPLYLGVDKGFFEDEGLKVTLESGQGGAAIVPGVASEQFEFGFSNNVSLLVAKQQGLPIKLVAAGNSTTGEVGNDFSAVVVPEGSAIKSAADLAGKTVAVNTLNNIGTVTINKVVEDDGGDYSGIEYVELAFPDMPAAVAGGQVDAAWVVEPFVSLSQAQGATPIAWNFAGTDPDLMIASYFTSEKTADSDPEMVEGFAAAMKKSLEYASENPDEVARILQTYTELDADAAVNITYPKWPSEINEDSIDLLADLAVEQGVLEEKPDIDAMLP